MENEHVTRRGFIGDSAKVAAGIATGLGAVAGQTARASFLPAPIHSLYSVWFFPSLMRIEQLELETICPRSKKVKDESLETGEHRRLRYNAYGCAGKR